MKKISVMIAALMVSTILTACWDRRELNDLAIVVGMGLDKKEDLVEVTTQIVNPSEVASGKGGTGYSPPVTTLSAASVTGEEAIRKLSTISPRIIFRSHLRILVIGEELAREGIAKVMDGISRDHELRSDFYIIVAKGTTAKEILEILTPSEKIPANSMFTSLEKSEELWAPTVKMQLNKVQSDLADPSKGIVLTMIQVKGDSDRGKTVQNQNRSEPYAKLQYTGLGLFKNDRLVAWLNEDESKGYNYIMGHVSNTIGHINCPEGGTLAVDVIRTTSKVKGRNNRGKPEIVVELRVEENINEVQCQLDLTKTATLQELEKLSNERLTEFMNSAIEKAKKHKSDIFGFGYAIEDADPKLWVKIKKDWDEYFANLDVTIKVDTQIRRLGTITNSILKKEE